MDEDIQSAIGYELFAVQEGRMPSDFKPMPAIGPGVFEIRVHERVETRLIYAAKFEEAVYVFHVFEKGTQKTNRRDIDLAKRRFADVAADRRET